MKNLNLKTFNVEASANTISNHKQNLKRDIISLYPCFERGEAD